MNDRPLDAGAPRTPAVRVVIWGIAIYAATRVAASVLEGTAMAAMVAQAVIAEWGVGRLGVVWTSAATPSNVASLGKRAAYGAGIGSAMAIGVAAFLVETNAALFVHADAAMPVVLVALVAAGLNAMRDELLLHGITLRAIEKASPLMRVLACGVTSAAAAFGEASTPRVIVAQGLLGVVFGALWVRDRGAWAAWGAHAAWLFATALVLRGGIYEARAAASVWGGADAGPLGGSAAVVSLLPFAVGAIVWAARSSPEATTRVR